MDGDEWRLCVEWLVRCNLLTSDHRLTKSDAQVIDFAQLIRDGVLLCHLLNHLSPGALNTKDFCQRPQMSQFLCLKNIRTFLKTCQDVFQIPENDLFDPNDLFEIKDFGKVIHTLSLLSCSEEAKKSNIQGFATRVHTDYHPLHTLASSSSGPSGDAYDLRDEDHEIYEDLCSLRRKSSVQGSVPVTKRDYCIKELVETEKNYIDALKMIIDCFIKRLRQKISEEDCQMIFMGVENLFTIHFGFYSDLSKACSNSRSFSYRSSSHLTIADCFIKWKEQFLAYGEFCSNLPKVQSILDKLSQNTGIQQCIVECQKEANGGRFRLRDLLSVPMQRVLKYHLLLKELIKNTDQMHPDRKSLERALEEMQDLSGYVNEVKRDNENLQWIEEVERSIIDLAMPQGTTLKDYGRLRKDGELRVRRHSEKKDRNLMIFLFDKVMLVCKIRMRDKLLWGESYNYKDVLVLSQYTVEENVSLTPKEREKMAFLLVDKKTKEQCLFISKTLEVRNKWIDEINHAHDNACPPLSMSLQHEFVMFTYSTPTICDVCRKLLKGVFFQGYKCLKTGTNVHKDCIKNAKDVAGPPVIPPKKDRLVPSTPVPNSAHRSNKVRVKAISTYQGIPAPPNSLPFLSFEVNEVFVLIGHLDDHWWQGKKGECEGYFPKSFVIVMKTHKSQSCRLDVKACAPPPLLPRPFSVQSHSISSLTSHSCKSLPLPPTPLVEPLLCSSPGLVEQSPRTRESKINSKVVPELAENVAQESECLANAFGDVPLLEDSRIIQHQKGLWQSRYQLKQHPQQMQVLQRLSVTEDVNNGGSTSFESGFMGELNRQEASKMLEKTPCGTFLVRVSNTASRRGEYALSIRYGLNNPVKHIKLQKTPEGMFFLVESKTFRSIPELVHFYQANSLEKSFPEVPIPLGVPYMDYMDMVDKSNGNSSSESTTPMSSSEPHIVGYCLASLDFSPDEPNQISFKAGEKIAIISKAPTQRGFWMGRVNDKIGFFPSNLVKELNGVI